MKVKHFLILLVLLLVVFTMPAAAFADDSGQNETELTEIQELDIEMSYPVHGTTTETPKNDDGSWDWSGQTNMPEVYYFGDEEEYSLYEDGDMPCAVWVDPSGDAPFEGEFELGNSYTVCVSLEAKEGYVFSEDTIIRVGAEESSEVTFLSDDMTKVMVRGTLEADHDWDEGEVTKEATPEENGEYTYHCLVEGCDETFVEEIEYEGDDEDLDDEEFDDEDDEDLDDEDLDDEDEEDLDDEEFDDEDEEDLDDEEFDDEDEEDLDDEEYDDEEFDDEDEEFVSNEDEMYHVSDHSEKTWLIDSEEPLVFEIIRDEETESLKDHFTGIKMDNEDLDPSMYTVSEEDGVLRITFSTDFLKELELGSWYDLEFTFDDGRAFGAIWVIDEDYEWEYSEDGIIVIKNAYPLGMEPISPPLEENDQEKDAVPKTGDETDLMTWMILMGAGSALTLALLKKRYN